MISESPINLPRCRVTFPPSDSTHSQFSTVIHPAYNNRSTRSSPVRKNMAWQRGRSAKNSQRYGERRGIREYKQWRGATVGCQPLCLLRPHSFLDRGAHCPPPRPHTTSQSGMLCQDRQELTAKECRELPRNIRSAKPCQAAPSHAKKGQEYPGCRALITC